MYIKVSKEEWRMRNYSVTLALPNLLSLGNKNKSGFILYSARLPVTLHKNIWKWLTLKL